MTGADALLVYAEVVECWPHSEVNKARMIKDLADVEFDHAIIAVETLYRDGREHAPSGAQIRGRVADLAIDAPDWGVVKAEIDRRRAAVGGTSWAHNGIACPYGRCDGTGLIQPGDDDDRPKHELVAAYCECRDEVRLRVAEAAGIHPLVDEFIRTVGRAEIAALDGSRITEAQVRDKYVAHVANARRGIVYQGLESGGLAGLERLHHERAVRAGLASPNKRGSGLHRPDIRASLPKPEDEDVAA